VKAILLIDHGSTRDESNRMLECMATLVRHLVGDEVVVEHAHMELAEPSIDAGFANCVRAGATEVIAFPYMLSPGKHSTRDIPRLVSEAARSFPGVAFRVTPAFGVHEKLAEVILLRADEKPMREAGGRCWDPHESGQACGDACRLRTDGVGVEGPASSVLRPAS
jgi:sirohydrochlorin ferrochelatase